MGITTLTEKDETLVLSLGGLQKGISSLEMAAAYSTIANDGQYIEPTFYTKIENKLGKTIIKTSQQKRKVVSKEVSYIVKQILTQPVIGSNGTATYCKISGVDVAAKTGTTDENYDRWLCGFTPYYTAVTWYGFDANESIEYNKKNPAGLLWANVMSRIHTGLNSRKFEKQDSISTCTICTKTGKRATSGCQNTYIEYFLLDTVPSLCNEHFGTEVKETTNSNTTQIDNKPHETIQDITHDIDVEDPQQIVKQQSPNNNINNNTNTNKTNTNQNNNTNINQNNNTNINQNSNTNYNTTNISKPETNNTVTNNTKNNTNNVNTSNNTNINDVIQNTNTVR